MRQNPKRALTKLNIVHQEYGLGRQIENIVDGFNDNVVFPKPVEYEDIDQAVLNFVRDEIKLFSEDKEAPTFTLFSNQRFSEYSQTWEHVDAEGNLLMDFKTVNRETNPSWGNNQGGMYNIPGDRRYTVRMKEVLDDNGTESYEVYSMGQPISVDLSYTINFVTADWGKLNLYNIRLNELFKSINFYIHPNGWPMPMKLDGIDDETEYSLDNRKIYIQSASVIVMGYIVPQNSFKIEKLPKRTFIGTAFDKTYMKPHVDVEEIDDEHCTVTLDFKANTDKVEFEFDENVEVNSIELENVRDLRIFINDNRVPNVRDGFKMNKNDEVMFKIFQVERNLPSKVVLNCTRR